MNNLWKDPDVRKRVREFCEEEGDRAVSLPKIAVLKLLDLIDEYQANDRTDSTHRPAG